MSKIEEMIRDLCLDGVKRVKLEDLAVSICTGLNPRTNFKLNTEGAENYYVTVKEINTNKIVFSSNTDRISDDAWEIIERRSRLEKGDVLFSGIGTIGKVAYVDIEVNNWNCSESVFLIKPKQCINGKFLTYILRSDVAKNQYEPHSSGSIMKGVRKETLKSLQIPLPPLPIQEKIVEILDKFSLLSAELEGRRKQYDFYRNRLLSFDSGSDSVQWKTLGEVGKLYGGLSGKSKKDFEDGNAKFITYKNVYSNLALAIDVPDTVMIYPGEKQNTVQYGDILFTGSSETPDECAMSSVLTTHTDAPLYLNSFCFGFRFNSLDGICPDFYKHYFRCAHMRKLIAKTAHGTTRFNVSKKEFAQLSIPMLPIAEQERIVRILDKFEALVTDLSAGLPAEIERVQKQYEYYRNKLLTF